MAFKLEAGVFIIAILALFAVGMFVQKTYEPFIITGSETMTRIPSSMVVNPGSTFQVCYTANSVSGKWGVSFIDSLSGGCTKSGSTEIKGVMVSDDADAPGPRCATVTAPQGGSCLFVGNYKFGTDPIVNFPSATVTISGVCTPSCSGKVCGDNGCGGSCGTCSSGKVCSNGQCVTTCPTGQTLCSDGTCKTTCVEPTCSELFSKTLNLISITGTACTDGYIIAGIIGILGMFIISRVLK